MATPQPVRVTFVSSHARRGGSERYLAALVTELGHGWVDEIVSLEQGPLVERLRAAGYPPVIVPTSGRPASVIVAGYRLRRFLSHRRSDAVHANGVKAALVSVIATIGLKQPVVWVKHDLSWDGPLARLIALLCTDVVCVSEAVARTFPVASRRKIHVVYTGISVIGSDRRVGRMRLTGLLHSPGSGPIIALVGSFHPVKGHMDLLSALPRVLDRVPDLRVVFIGGSDPSVPAHQARVRRWISLLGLDRTVTLLGHRDDAIELVSGCDAIVIPSKPGTEGLPLVALESEAVGTPVVAHAVGGLPEALGRCGVLVPPGETRALADALVRVLTDARLRDELAQCGQDRVDAEFSLARMIDAMKERYYRASARTSGRRG